MHPQGRGLPVWPYPSPPCAWASARVRGAALFPGAMRARAAGQWPRRQSPANASPAADAASRC
eukprot:14527022-Alexandrium_andersonii.AAC.1